MTSPGPSSFFDRPSTRPGAPFVLLVGRTREDRRGVLAGFQYLDEHQRPVFLYLTARRRKVEVLRAAFAERSDKPPAFLPEVHTWADWRDRLADRFGDGRVPLPSVARELLMGTVWRTVRERARHWRCLPDRPSVRRALADLVEDWEAGHSGLHPLRLPDDPASLPFPGDRPGSPHRGASPALRHDLALVVSAWREALARTPGWTDRPTAARGLLRALRAPPPPLLRSLQGFGSLIVDDLIHLPPLERELLAAFVDAFRRAAPDASVHLCLEGCGPTWGAERFFLAREEPDPGLRATLPLRASWSRWLSGGGAARDDAAEGKIADADPDRLDLADLSAVDGRVPGAPQETVGGVRVRRYNDELAEVRALARALKARLLAGHPVHEHHVAFPALDRYAPIVRDLLPAYGIPVRVERGEPLRSSPPVAAARKLLSVAVDGADRESLRSLSASGWIRPSAPPAPGRVRAAFDRAIEILSPDTTRIGGALSAALDRLETGEWSSASVEDLRRAAVEAGADGPRPGAWIPPILARVFVRPPGDARGWDRVVGIVEAALRLDALVGRLKGLGSAADVGEVVRRFRELLNAVGLGPPDGDSEQPGRDAEALEIAEADASSALATLHTLIDSMEADLEAVRTAVPGSDSGAALELFREALERALDDAFVRPPRERRGVQVVGLPDLHGVDVPWLWVGGLVEGDFPRSARPSFLLPAAARRLVPTVDRGEEDRAVFASLLRNAGHGDRLNSAVLILSHPHTTDGSDSVPSAVLQDLVALRVVEGTLGEWFAARQEEEEGALPDLLGARELLARPRDAERMPGAMKPEIADEVRRQRALAAARSDPTGFGRWDGVVGLGGAHRRAAVGWVRSLLGVDLDDRGRPRLVASASGLERWASCSIRWFFEQVLAAEEPDEYDPEPSPAEQGSLLHAALERLLAERIEAVARGEAASASIANLDAAGLLAVKRRARALVREAAPRVVPDRPGPWVERALRELEAGLDPDDPSVEPWNGPLATFLDEAATPFLDLEPKAVEWRFEGLDPAEEASRIDGVSRAPEGVRVSLRGSVDRIDVARSGEAGLGGARLAVLDYKSGRLSNPSGRVDRGLLLQPVVYAAAARRLAPGHPVDGLLTGYLEVREGVNSGRRFFLGDGAVIRALRDSERAGKALGVTSRPVSPGVWAAWLRRADMYGRWIADGVFPPTLAGPVHARCDRCPHRRACRVDHLRNADLARAAADGLALLPAPVAVSEPDEEPA